MVSSELADSCKKSNFCVCDTDYFDTEKGESFETVLEEQHATAIDWTIREIEREPKPKPMYVDETGAEDIDGCGFACEESDE